MDQTIMDNPEYVLYLNLDILFVIRQMDIGESNILMARGPGWSKN